MIELLFYSVAIVVVLFAATVLFGSPYVPTLKSQIEKIFTLYHFGPHDVLVDLGSGDGLLLRVAAKKGVRAVGYELNPVLYLISIILGARYQAIQSRLGNFWTVDLPDDATVVYVFLNQRHMKKLQKKLQAHVERTKKPLHLISFGFKIKDMKPLKQDGAMSLYRF